MMGRKGAQNIEFATVTKGKEVVRIGRAVSVQPKVRYKGGGIPWLDDKRAAVKKGGINWRETE